MTERVGKGNDSGRRLLCSTHVKETGTQVYFMPSRYHKLQFLEWLSMANE